MLNSKDLENIFYPIVTNVLQLIDQQVQAVRKKRPARDITVHIQVTPMEYGPVLISYRASSSLVVSEVASILDSRSSNGTQVSRFFNQTTLGPLLLSASAKSEIPFFHITNDVKRCSTIYAT
jgi:hypothetical protein